MTPAHPVILVTGVSGLVGGEAVRLLRSHRLDAEVLTVGRGESNSIRADLTRDLPPLSRNVTHILHCAADTRFGRPLEEIRGINVEGTERLLAYAATCPDLRTFVHVSTAYVCGLDAGPVPQALLDQPCAFANTYQQSKWEAEQLVASWSQRLPASIVRISSIFGHSLTGEVTQFNYTHQLLKLLGRNVLPVAPLDRDAPVDLVPVDWAAARLTDLLLGGIAAGSVRHLCAGQSASITAGEMVDRAVRGYERNPEGHKWLPIRLPEFVTLEEYDKFRQSVAAGSDRLLREVVRLLDFFLPHLALRQEFAASVEPAAPPVASYFDRVVDQCLARNWGA